MILLGLTGGIGAGKTVASEFLHKHAVAVVDTDLIAREVVAPGQPALAEVAAAFGGNLVGTDGQLRRDEVARIVFSNVEARRRLESILHPRIRGEWQRVVAGWRSSDRQVGCVVIPLLFETDAAGFFDATISLACTTATQKSRLEQRSWSAEQIAGRLAAQWSMEQKMAAATFVVWTEAGLDVHEAQLTRILEKLSAG